MSHWQPTGRQMVVDLAHHTGKWRNSKKKNSSSGCTVLDIHPLYILYTAERTYNTYTYTVNSWRTTKRAERKGGKLGYSVKNPLSPTGRRGSWHPPTIPKASVCTLTKTTDTPRRARNVNGRDSREKPDGEQEQDRAASRPPAPQPPPPWLKDHNNTRMHLCFYCWQDYTKTSYLNTVGWAKGWGRGGRSGAEGAGVVAGEAKPVSCDLGKIIALWETLSWRRQTLLQYYYIHSQALSWKRRKGSCEDFVVG